MMRGSCGVVWRFARRAWPSGEVGSQSRLENNRLTLGMNYCALTLTIAALVAGESAQPTVTLLDGRTMVGAVTAWSGQSLTIQTDAGEQQVPATELLEVSWPAAADAATAAAPAMACIELIDGTRIPLEKFTVADRVATIETPLAAAPLELRAELIKRVELVPPTPASTAAWEGMDRKEITGDTLLVIKRDGESFDYLSGVVGDVTPEQADFQWDGDKVQVKRSKIAGIAYYQAKPRTLKDAVCELTLADGSLVSARKVALAGESIAATTPAGVELSLPLASVRRADFSGGKLAYLGDMKPTQSAWEPRIAWGAGAQLIGAQGQPRSNESFAGSPLSLLWRDDPLPARRDIRTYNKGVAIRSRTELEYRLPAEMRRFVAIAGIDPQSAHQGHVSLEIRADDRVVWEGEIDGKKPPVEIDVELGAARRLRLLVDYGKNLDYGDRLHLVEARVTK